MSNHDLAVIVLAAGKGTRLKSSLAKVLHSAGGRTLVEQIVRACEPLKARETIVVVGHQAEQVARVVEPIARSGARNSRWCCLAMLRWFARRP